MCEGEDIDRMMAQAIALEDTHRATARDHLYGIDDSVLQEGQYANRVRGNLMLILKCLETPDPNELPRVGYKPKNTQTDALPTELPRP